MPTLTEETIAKLLAPYLTPPSTLLHQLSLYLDLLLKWNAHTNLTAIRDPHEIVRRHFGESLFAAQHLRQPATLLDLGSGAGFPGLPIALLYPHIAVTLAESQNKKSTFLRETVRTLNLPNVQIWPARAETLPPNRLFHTITLRAVDNMQAALTAAAPRATHQLAILTTQTHQPQLPPPFTNPTQTPIPQTQDSILLLTHRPQ